MRRLLATRFYLCNSHSSPLSRHKMFTSISSKLLPFRFPSACCSFAVSTITGCVSAQLCLTLGNPLDCSPPGFSVLGIFQARILEWVAIPTPGDLPNPGIESLTPALTGGFSPIESPQKHTYTHTHTRTCICKYDMCVYIYARVTEDCSY